MEQLSLGLQYDRNFLRDYFERRSGLRVELTITDNSTRMISVKTREDTVYLRLHRIFLEADKDVISEVARFIKKRRCSTPLIRGFIKEKSGFLNAPPNRKLTHNPLGKHYDLSRIFDKLNKEYFGGEVSSYITWGARTPKYAVRRRTLGSFGLTTNTIRINPLLDDPGVPPYFIEFIIYHEMLHAYLGVGKGPLSKRRSIHSREFRIREREFRDYEKAVAWERTGKV